MSRRALAAIIVSLLLLTLILVGGVLLFMARVTGGLGPAHVDVQAPQYPVPAKNMAAELLAAAGAVYPDRDAIATAYQSPTAMADPATAELLSRHDPHIKQAVAALGGECLLPRRPFTNEDLDYWNRLRTLGRLLVLRGRMLEHEGRYGEAAQTHLHVLRLAEVTTRNGAALGSMVGVAMVAVATEDLERSIAAAAASGEGKALPAALRTLHDRRVTDEQTLLEEWAQMIEGSETMARDIVKQQGTRSPAPGLVRAWFRRSANKALLEQLPEARKPYWERSYKPRSDDALSAPGSLLMGERYAAKAAQRDAVLLGCRILAALELFRRDHGAPPQRLEDLVPEYLEALPPDPFTGRPFGYRVAGKDYHLYSVGPDRRDDGGSRRVDGRTEQGDIVIWPAGRVTVTRH